MTVLGAVIGHRHLGSAAMSAGGRPGRLESGPLCVAAGGIESPVRGIREMDRHAEPHSVQADRRPARLARQILALHGQGVGPAGAAFLAPGHDIPGIRRPLGAGLHPCVRAAAAVVVLSDQDLQRGVAVRGDLFHACLVPDAQEAVEVRRGQIEGHEALVRKLQRVHVGIRAVRDLAVRLLDRSGDRAAAGDGSVRTGGLGRRR